MAEGAAAMSSASKSEFLHRVWKNLVEAVARVAWEVS